MRAVLDINVFVSARIKASGEANKIFNQAGTQYEVCLSDFMFRKIEAVLRYPHIQRKYPHAAEDIPGYIEMLRDLAVLVTEKTEITESQDPEDNHILATAVDGKTDYLVTYNISHFPATYRGVKIVLPGAFRQILQEAQTQDKSEDEDAPSEHQEEP